MGKAVDEIRVNTGIVRGISDESKSFETGENFLEHDATLDAGQVGAKTEVRATGTKGHMVVGVTSNIDVIWIFKRPLVAIR